MGFKLWIVTGASSGIGYELCCHLAQRKKNIVAIARRKDKLNGLQNKYPEFITIIQADLSTQSGRNTVIEKISLLGKVAGLINNAAGTDAPHFNTNQIKLF